MKARKENKVYTIDEAQKEQYRRQGFDIYNEDGKLVSHAKGKTIDYESYEAVKKALEVLKTERKSQKKAGE